jgi:hypothetical protein
MAKAEVHLLEEIIQLILVLDGFDLWITKFVVCFLTHTLDDVVAKILSAWANFSQYSYCLLCR